MPVFDASGFAGDLLGWKSELGARVHDILARKSLPGAGALGAIARKLESAVSTAALKGALKDLVAYFRKDVADVPTGREEELEALFSRIREFGRKESIENYGAYIFTVDVRI